MKTSQIYLHEIIIYLCLYLSFLHFHRKFLKNTCT